MMKKAVMFLVTEESVIQNRTFGFLESAEKCIQSKSLIRVLVINFFVRYDDFFKAGQFAKTSSNIAKIKDICHKPISKNPGFFLNV